jgi:hypothetical protein
MKTLFASWNASRLDRRARALRRSLRDHQRREQAIIFALEKRSRGLRLFEAWTRNPKTINISLAPEPAPAIATPIFRDAVKTAA